jgi:hypothetical protein
MATDNPCDGDSPHRDNDDDISAQPLAPFSTPVDLLNLVDTVSYFLHLKMASLDKKMNIRVPPGVDTIIEIARGLPAPRPEEWGSLAVGRISMKRKYKGPTSAGAEEGKASKRRATWTEESAKELVELVENDELRREKLGDDGSHAGNINWASLARRYGFSGAAPVYRKYEEMTGKKAPGVRKRRDPSKPVIQQQAEPGWEDHEKSADLIRLVQNDAHRLSVLGTSQMDWNLIAEYLHVTAKSARAKYHELTGQ